METAYEIIESMHDTFGQSCDYANKAFKCVYNAKMKDESLVREHTLNLMTYFNVHGDQ